MGCDIHLHSEIKVGGIWHHYSQPRLRRDYELFARMANVRNDGSIKPISEPRGLPLDVSYTTKVVSDYEQGHSHSWLSSEEIGALVEEVSKRRAGEDGIGYYSWEHRELGYLFGNDWDFKKYPLEDGSGYSGQPKWLEDVRFVFWFDS